MIRNRRGGVAVVLRREDNPIELAIRKLGGDAKISLLWSSPFPFESKQPVPRLSLFP